ncbi:Hypothetical predicted protein, partial [Podarcis lilfordi]
ATNQNKINNIVNLSQQALSPAEESVLSRGLSFCPAKSPHMIQFYGDLEAFFRRLRLKEYFQHTQQQDKSEQTTTSQHNTSQPTGEQQPPSQQNTDHQLPPKSVTQKGTPHGPLLMDAIPHTGLVH